MHFDSSRPPAAADRPQGDEPQPLRLRRHGAACPRPRSRRSRCRKTADIEYAKELYLGLREAADPFVCPVVGGDTGSWDGKLVLTVTILGRSGGVKPVTRSGAKPGDAIYVTGPLGGSILGRHMTFEPRVFARPTARGRPGSSPR